METFNAHELLTCNAGDCYCVERNPGNSALECLAQELDCSLYGRLLKENVGVRFGRWRWDDESRMKHFLPDTDPVFHGLHQAKTVGLPMIEFQNNSKDYQPFTKEESRALLTAHVMHDAHEGLTGDVPKPDKTRASDELELVENLKVVAQLLGEEAGSDFMRRYRGIVGDFEGWSFAGRAFSVGEQVGYFQTGIRAWSLRGSGELSQEERDKCESLGREVCLSGVDNLWRGGTEFAYPLALIGIHKAALEEMR